MECRRKKENQKSNSTFPDEVLERILGMLKSRKDKSTVSLVCKEWFNAERWSRRSVFIGNCYSVSPEILTRRFPNIRSVTLKGKPRFSDFNLVPANWGADIHSWLVVFAEKYPWLEELRLKRMTVTDESLEFLALKFPNFKALSLLSCDGFSTDGLASIATNCKNLTELDIQENGIEDKSGNWLSCFPDSFTSLEVLNFANLHNDVNFDALEKLVSRCKSLKTLKVNKSVTLEQLQRLIVHVPQLGELGTGSFSQELTSQQCSDLESALKNCKNLHTLSGLWVATAQYLPVLYSACTNLTFLNFSYAPLDSDGLTKLLVHCPKLQRLWVVDTVEDKGLEAVGSHCPLLEELRVFPADPFDEGIVHGVTESGFIAVSQGCPRLHYVLYFCRQMTNAAVATVVQNCPDFTHFRLCIMHPGQLDYLTQESMDEAFGAVVKTCTKLQRLAVSGYLTDLTFEYIGKYAKNLETLSVAFAGSSDWGMRCVLDGCPKLRKLEVRNLLGKRSSFTAAMVYVKAQKSKAYFKRYQVKFKRRREGKTDYRARIRLINQDKNKYNTPKYRFVVRFSNKDIVAQIISASIAGDIVLAAAYAHELPQYGLEVGLTNYAAAYCTGLLLARRVLNTLEMDEEYEGNVEATGEDYSVEPAESRRPFRALLDVGLIRTTTGNRVFGALKGALDGGLDIPHSDKRFAGFDKEKKELDAEVHRKYVFGGHVAAYMKILAEDEPEKYQSHFSEYIKRGIEADGIEALYKKVHAAIRADPTLKKSDKQPPKEHKRYNLKKLTYEERKAKLIARVASLNSAADNDEDDE